MTKLFFLSFYTEFLPRFCSFFHPLGKKLFQNIIFLHRNEKKKKMDFSSLQDKFFPKDEFQKSKSGFGGYRGCRGHNYEHSNVKGTRYRTKESPIQHQKWKKVP